MSATLDFKQSGHLDPALREPGVKVLNAGKLTGRWVNTNHETRGVAEITVEQDGEHFIVSVLGVGDDGPIEWPTADVTVLANLEEEAGQRARALAATFNFGFMKAETYVRVNKGVLVIVLFASFEDGSRRSNYVNREFFRRA